MFALVFGAFFIISCLGFMISLLGFVITSKIKYSAELVSTCNSELFTEANSEDILSDKVQWCSMDGEILRRAENE